jgi:hypothetical protein
VSGDAIGTAMDALFMVGGGLGFARIGWGGLNRRRAAAGPAEPQSACDGATLPPPRASTGWQVFSALILLFGGFIALCGLILGLRLILPGNAA